MQLPSGDLMQRLARLGLHVPADLRGCAGWVRRLARGLPVTDSLWIDALIAGRKLTPFQGRRLEMAADASLLLTEKYVVRTPVQLAAFDTIYEGRELGQSRHLLIGSMACPASEADAAAQRAVRALRSLSTCQDKVPALPFDTFWEAGSLYQVSSFQPGETLQQLLIRQGRLPELFVQRIAQELFRQLSAAETFGVHGDLRPGNLWLTRQGELRILNWGLLDAVSPVITIHTPLPEETGDHLAPERLQAQRRASISSDAYALGCLLWQLLAGRPPFAVTDPLEKMVAHRQRVIPEIRTRAPEVSTEFAELLQVLTARDPARRISSYNDPRLNLPGMARSRLRGRRLPVATSPLPASRSRRTGARGAGARRRSVVATLTACLLISLAFVTLAWNRSRIGLPGLSLVSAATEFTSFTPEFSTEKKRPADVSKLPAGDATAQLDAGAQAGLRSMTESSRQTAAVTPAGGVAGLSSGERNAGELQTEPLLDLPEPVQGIVTLLPATHYRLRDLQVAENLQITTDPSRPATIHLSNVPARLTANQVRFEHVLFFSKAMATEPELPALQIHSSLLLIDHCRLDARETSSAVPVIRWQTPAGESAGQLAIRASELLSTRPVLQVDGPLSSALLENVFCWQAPGVLRLTSGAAPGYRVPVMLNSCTLRECGPVVSLPASRNLSQSGRLSLQGRESLIDVPFGQGLIELTGAAIPPDWQQHVEIAAQGLIVPEDLLLALFRNPITGVLEELPVQELKVDGLLNGRYQFLPIPGRPPERAELILDSLPIRMSERPPGVDDSLLPAPAVPKSP